VGSCEEDLDAKGLVELPGSSRNRAGAAWETFLRMLEYNCEREGTQFVAVNPRGTSKECVLWRFDGQAVMDARTLLSCLRIRGNANAVVRLRLTGSRITV
jgi:hypothetical protein